MKGRTVSQALSTPPHSRPSKTHPRAVPLRAFWRIAVLLAAMAGAVAAQTFPFQLLITSGTTAATVANGSSVGVNAEIGQTVTVHVTATYLPSNSANTATISQAPTLLGASLQFSVTAFPKTLPLQLSSGNQFSFDVTFKSSSAAVATAQLTLPFTETAPSAGASSGPTTIQNAIVLIFQGSSPSFQLSYVLQTNLNVVPLQPGGTISFGGTLVNTTVLATLNITNIGSGFGTIQTITPPAGPAFKLTGTPLLPANLAPAGSSGNNLPLQISYTPTAATTDNDQVLIKLTSGTTLTVLLQGNGITPTYSYTVLTSTPTPVTPPGPITLPDAAIGSTSSVTLRVQNTGSANGVINNPPSIGGQAFTLSIGSLFPLTLKPSDSFTFSINFTPTQPGQAKGTLVVGGDLFNLNGNGLGPQLAFSYNSSAGTINLNNGDSVVFTPVPVSQSEQITFTANNTGTQPAIISNIAIGEAKSPFSVSGLQSLPFSLAPGASTQFNVTFAPTTVGPATGTLRVNTTVVGLTGSGNQPPPLPAYTIQGPTGTAAAQTQSPIGLTLASGYPVDLAGTLTLTTGGNLPTDQNVQFSTGGRTVQFVIPANSTSANFAGQGSKIFLQTGTVAENIILTPDFTTQAGGIDLTPSSPATLQFNIGTAAPVLLAVTVTNLASNGFVLNVTGYSTTRSVNSITVKFAPAQGYNFGSAAQTTVDLHSSSAAWFQTSASQAFGGEFEVSIPFTLTGPAPPAGKTLIQAIASVSATVTNDIGTSSSLTASLQ